MNEDQSPRKEWYNEHRWLVLPVCIGVFGALVAVMALFGWLGRLFG